jgi:hypothetical protein
MKGPFDAIAANGADFTFAAGNTGGGDTIAVTGREVILVYNSHAVTAYSFTVTSQVDEKNRTADITTYNLDAGEFAVLGIGLTNSPGWKNASTGLVSVTVSNAAVKWAVLRLPAGYPG